MPMEAAGRPEAAGAGWSAGDVIRILKQRIFLILFIWILAVGATVGITAYWQKEYPSFRAVGVVYAESPQPKTPLQLTERQVHIDLMNRFVADQAVLLKDESLLSELVQDAAVRETAWFQSQPGESGNEKAKEALDKLKEDLGVNQLPDTSFLRVVFSTRNSKDAPVIVNTAIDRYLAKVKGESYSELGAELKEVTATQTQLEKSLQLVLDSKEDYLTKRLGAPGVMSGLNVVGQELLAYSAEVTRLEADKLMYQAQYENLRGVDPERIMIPPETRRLIEADNRIMMLRESIRMQEQRQHLFAERGLGPNHRQVKDGEASIGILDDQLRDLLAQKEAEEREFSIYQAERMYLNATQAELQLSERKLESEEKQRDIDRGMAAFQQLEEKQLLLEDRLARINDYISQLQMIRGAQGTVQVRQIGFARPPEERHQPRWEYNIPVGFLLGLLLGVGLAMLLELTDTSVRTSRDIIRHVHVPILGTVPDLDDEELPIEEVELACHTAPRSIIAEAFRGIRTNLLLSSPAERQRCIMVTSPKPEEGKTSVATNLAISLAQSGRRVLLVDANFHRPTLQRLFPKTRDQGLSNVLIGQGRVADLASRTELPNLDVLTSGPIPPNPTELLSSSYLREMINQATEHYDQIILDAPPVLLVSDVLVVTGSVDGVILVCRAKMSSRGTVQRAREQLERVNGHIFGAVLNAAQVTRGGYFREQIRTYYDYQPEEALTATPSPVLPKDDNGDEDESP